MTAEESAGLGRGRGASSEAEPAPNISDKIKAIGGLVAVAVGVIVVGAIAVIALVKDSETSATIASSTGGVIAAIVGAYFGVKVGTDQSRNALEAQQAEAAKAEVYAAHVPANEAGNALELAEAAAERVMAPRRR